MLKVGDLAPKFSLENQDGKIINLSDFSGKKVVVYFYPKDNTPGCTRQACSFKSSYDDFKTKDIKVIGISKDSISSHQKFINDFDLPFLLLSDPKLDAIKAYDVWKEKKMFGKLSFGVNRSTFIIDENGKIEKVFANANPDTNASDILEYLS